MHERHQECFNSVEFGRSDRAVMREIVDDTPSTAVVAQCLRRSPHLAHAGYVRMRGLRILATRWSLQSLNWRDLSALYRRSLNPGGNQPLQFT